MATASQETARAIRDTLISPNVSDSNAECANVVDVIDNLSRGVFAVARAILPRDLSSGHDAAGGKVGCLVEAAMGMTAGLVRIADAISDLAQAVRERQE